MKIENWNGNKIRFVEHGGEWWAVAQDVTSALGFKQAKDGTKKTPDKYKGVTKVPTLGGEQEMIVLNEKGLYRLIMRSNKPEAEAFQDWVFDTIKTLREATGLEGFEVFRMMDKQHQKEAMEQLRKGIAATRPPVRLDFIKANTIANKAVSNMHGYQKMVKKGAMTPKMLVERESVLKDTVNLMELNERYGMGVSVSGMIYRGYNHNDTTT